MGANRAIAAWALALGMAATASAQEMRIQFAEKVQLAAQAGNAEFDAYGRRFALTLESNDRLLAKLPAQRKAALAGYHLLRGRLTGNAASWVRLTEVGGRAEGYIWDGSDLYAVTTYAKISRYLSNPLTAAANETVVFRLSDAINVLPGKFCAVEKSADGLASNNGLVQYRKLVADLAIRAEAAVTMSRQIEIALIADDALASKVLDPTAEMLTSFNAVDGIFSEQVGLLILPSVIRIVSDPGPFTATNPSTLLDQLSTYRKNTPAIAAPGIAHLLTGRDLDGNTAGIARLDGVCSLEDGVSLSEGWRGTYSTGLVMAHELGHNFGAQHDGEAGGVCAAVPLDFLMAPSLNFSETFSQCSLDTMRPVIAAASCVTPAAYAHVELPVEGPPVVVENDTPVTLPFVVSSTGTQAAQGVRLQITVPSSLVVTSIVPTGVCTAGATGLDCNLGSIPAAQQRRVDVTFLPGVLGGYTVDATVSATNNQNTRDNSQHQQVHVLPNSDTSIAVTSSTATALFGDAVDVTINVSSLKSHASKDVRVGFFGAGLTVVSVTVPGGTCDIRPDQTFCLLGDVAPGTTRQIVLRTTAGVVGDGIGEVYLSSLNDSNNVNNNARFNLRTNSVRDVGLEEITPHSFVQFGMPYEFRARLRSFGVQPIANVSVDVWFYFATSGLNDVESVTVGGVSCTRVQINNYRCEAGTLAAGEVRLISVKGRATELGQLGFDLRSYSPDQDNSGNDRLERSLNVRYGLDASVSVGNFIVGPELQELQGSISVLSNGLQPSANAVMVVELPAALRFTRFFVQNTTNTCAIIDAQHLRCVHNLPSQGSVQSVSYYVIGDVPGSYQGRATVTMAGDEDPSNDTATWPITITANIDIGVQAFSMPQYLVGATELTVPLAAFTGSRPVPGATAFVQATSGAQLLSLTTTAGSCTRVDIHRFTCALGDLPASSSVTLQARVAAATPIGHSSFDFSVAAPGDNNTNNNQRSASFHTVDGGDLRVSVAATSVTATTNEIFAFPSITIRHTGPIVDGRLEVTLPTGTTVRSISGSPASCSGSTTLLCSLSSWPEDQALQIDLGLSVGAGSGSTFTSMVRVRSGNDTDPSNDEVSVTMTVNPATSTPPVVTPPANPPSTGGGGSAGGGGGRMELLALILLLSLVLRRCLQMRAARKAPGGPTR